MRGAIAILVLAGCTELPDVARGECGNGVVEPALGEECDGAGSCGATDGANACRFVCDVDGAGCPTGYQCGADQRCRLPTEDFAVTGVRTAGVSGVSAADMDGDGAADLLGYDSRGLLIRWGDADGSLEASTRVPMAMSASRTTIPDVDGNGQRDLAIPIGDIGFGVFVGDGARGFMPAAQSAIPLSFGDACVPVTIGAVRTDGATTGEPQMLLSIGGTLMSFLEGNGCDADPELDCVLSAAGGEIVGERFVSAPLGYGAASGVSDAEHWTAGVVGTQTVSVWGENASPAVLRPERIATWVLDEPLGADGRVDFAHLDGDGCWDLLVDTGSGGSLQVVYSVQALGTCLGLAGARTRHERPNGTVLGLGDLDADGLAELIYVDATASTEGDFGGNAIFTYEALGDRSGFATQSWVATVQESPLGAEVLDYNHDGWNDLVLAYAGVMSVDFFLNYEGQGFTAFPVEVGGEPRRMVTGDFDGDLLEDLVLTARDATDPQGRDRGVAIYGEADGRPVGAQFGDFLASARPIRIDGGVQPNTDSIVLVSNRYSEEPAECERRLALLIGDASRMPVSPYVHLFAGGAGPPDAMYPLGVMDVSAGGEPRVLVAGMVAPTGPGATEPDVAVSLLGFDDAAYTDLGVSTVITSDQLPAFDVLFAAQWRDGDLDLDGTGEAIALVNQSAVVVRVAGDAIETTVQPLDERLVGSAWFDLVDLDGDLDLDAVGSSGGAVAPGGGGAEPAAPTSSYWMVENQGGTLDFTAPTVLALPADLYCVAADAIVSTDSGLPQLVSACYLSTGGTALAFATFDPAADAENVSGVRTLAIDADLFDLEVADFTGDGLDDIAILGSTQTVTLLRQCHADEVVSGSCAATEPLP